MNDRTMIAVVLTALGLGAGVFLFENKVARREAPRMDPRVFAGIDRSAINRIVLNSGDRRVELAKDGENWKMTAPVEDRTDRRQVAALLDAIVDLREAARPIEARGGRVVGMAEYGLDKPSEKVVVSYGEAAAAREVALNLGNAVEGGSGEGGAGRVYAALNEETGRVLIVDDRLRQLAAAIGRDRNYYRSRDLFEPNLAKESQRFFLRARFGDKGEQQIAAQIVRSTEGPPRWELTAIDAETEKEWEALIKTVRVEDPEESRPARDRVDPAKVDALIAVLNELKIESFVDDEIAGKMRLPGLAGVAEEDAAKRFARFRLTDRDIQLQLSLFHPTRATVMQVRPGVLQLIPTAQIAVSKATVEGRPDLVYASRTNEGEKDPSVFAVRRELLDKLPRTVKELRDPSLLPAAIDEVKSIRIIRGGQTIELRKEPPTSQKEWTIGDGGLEADGSLVQQVLNAVREAKAEGYRDWPELRGERLDDTQIDLTVTLKADPSEKKDAGKAKGKAPPETKLSVLFGRFPEKAKEKPKEANDKKDKADEKKDKADEKKDAKDPKDEKAADKDGKDKKDAAAKPAAKPTVAAVVVWNATKPNGRDLTVRLIEAEKVEIVRKARLEYYNRNYKVAEAGDVVGFRLTRPDGEYELERKTEGAADEWRVKAPYAARADNAVSSWPHNWGRLDESRVISKVVSDDAKDAGLYGLEKPVYKLVLRHKRPLTDAEKKEADDKAAAEKAEREKADKKDDKKAGKDEPKRDDFKIEEKTILIGRVPKPKGGDVGPQPAPAPAPAPAAVPGKPDEFHWYLQVVGHPLIYEVQYTAVAGLDVELHDTRLANLPADYQPTEIAFAGPAGAYTLTREEKDASPAGGPSPAGPQREEVFTIRIGAGKPEAVHADRKADAAALFNGFQSLARDAIKADKFRSHQVKDEAVYARYKLADEKECVKVTVTAKALDTATRRPVAGKAPIVVEILVGPQVEIDGTKLRAVRPLAEPVIVTLKEADLGKLTRPAADYLAPKPLEIPALEKKDSKDGPG
jgi:hypothetical protein